MKMVFGSNAELAHVWAQQKQEEGRGNNLYFRGNTLFSYGSHFRAGVIHKGKDGKPFAVINSYNYSMATSKHLNYARRAVRGLMPLFLASCPEDLNAVCNYLDGAAVLAYEAALKKVKVESRHDIDFILNNSTELYDTANTFRALVGKRPIKHDIKLRAKVSAHLKKRLARYHELNTPEMVAKRERVKLAREKREAELAQEQLAGKVQDFRAGRFYTDNIHGLPYDLLRFETEENLVVQTSSGARVPAEAARTLYRAIKAGKSVLGAEIGSFTVVAITDTEGDKIIKIGCHRILLSEADKLFGQAAPVLQLVGGV